jgi:flagellar biosynthesis protein
MHRHDPNRRSAVALAYDQAGGEAAPRVVAKGYGLVADMIVKRARDAGLYVHESPEMVSLLMGCNLDSHIPPLLYQAVAELLAWLYRIENDGVAAAPPGRMVLPAVDGDAQPLAG